MSKRPNVIFLIADQWSPRIADGSGNNHGPVRTPSIDRLAAEGVPFHQQLRQRMDAWLAAEGLDVTFAPVRPVCAFPAM